VNAAPLASAAPLAAVAAALGVLALWEVLAAVEALAVTRTLARGLAPLLAATRDGREPSAPERHRLALVGTVALLAAGWLLAGPLAGLALATGGPGAVRIGLRHRRRRYRAELERAAPLLARALADALGAGHSIRGALADAGAGLDGAVASEVSAASAALALGEPTEAVLEHLRRRARSRAYDTIVAAILLQRDAGGDLARLLRELAASQEEAARLAEDAHAATSQARFTGFVVAGMPAGAAALTELASPGTLGGMLRDPLSAWLVGFAAFLQAVALVAIRRLARVRA
jgi:tight adherence protein B